MYIYMYIQVENYQGSDNKIENTDLKIQHLYIHVHTIRELSSFVIMRLKLQMLKFSMYIYMFMQIENYQILK